MKSFKLISGLLIIAILASCNKKLDVSPQNTITPEQITTAEDVRAVVFGAYSTMQNANEFGEKYNTASELLFNEGDLRWEGTFAQYTDLIEKQQTPQNSVIYQTWANSYQTIAAVNLALDKLDLVTEDERPVLEGEARFIRALIYFELVNLYAKPYSMGNTTSNPGVPLVLEPVQGYESDRDKRPRASVEEVYAQILDDLNFAVSNLPPTADNYRASSYSALAILSRVYLAQAKYAEAAEAANNVIEDSVFSLTPSFAAAFNNVSNSSEDIFAIQQTSQSNSGTADFGMATFYSATPAGRGEIQVTDEHVAKFEPDDTRGQFIYEGESISGAPGLFTGKWQELYRTIPVVRLAEMYLTRAEGNYMAGTNVGPNTPLEDVNVIRRRAGATPLTALAGVEDIINERLLELAFEGEKFLTMKRLRMDVGTLSYDDPFLVLPIPQREVDLGNALPQNEGY